MSKYSEEQTAELVAQGAWTYAQAVEWAEANGFKPRSTIAKIKSLGLPYEPKPVRVTKAGEPVVHKDQYVSAIEAALDTTIGSLIKVSKADLERLTRAVGAEMPTPRVKT